MKVRFKKLKEDAVVPCYAKPGDAGLDLTACSMERDADGNVIYGTGIAVEIPEGYVGLLFPRSSISKYGMILTNCVGVIDSGYRGEILFKFKSYVFFAQVPNPNRARHYKVGDKIGQLIIMSYPQIELEEVDELSDTERGTDGFGSTQ